MSGTVKESLDLFHGLRERGIAAITGHEKKETLYNRVTYISCFCSRVVLFCCLGYQ